MIKGQWQNHHIIKYYEYLIDFYAEKRILQIKMRWGDKRYPRKIKSQSYRSRD